VPAGADPEDGVEGGVAEVLVLEPSREVPTAAALAPRVVDVIAVVPRDGIKTTTITATTATTATAKPASTYFLFDLRGAGLGGVEGGAP